MIIQPLGNIRLVVLPLLANFGLAPAASPVINIGKHIERKICSQYGDPDMKQHTHSVIMLTVFIVVMMLTAACTPAATSTPTNSIQGVIWQWTSLTNQTTKQTTTVSNPENYTITFNADGTLNGKADCNNFTGTYSQENGFTIKLGATTMAYCGEASLDQQYLNLLSNVAAGGPDGAGNLALENAGGEQRMLFKNGGAATK
jgi:heat shock protein HslJ